MPTVTYRTHAKDRKTGRIVETEKSGDVAWLRIGSRRIKCALQRVGRETPDLVHVASGQIIVHASTISAIKVENLMRNRCKLPDRHAAEIALARIVIAKGDDVVLGVLDAAPVLNA